MELYCKNSLQLKGYFAKKTSPQVCDKVLDMLQGSKDLFTSDPQKFSDQFQHLGGMLPYWGFGGKALKDFCQNIIQMQENSVQFITFQSKTKVNYHPYYLSKQLKKRFVAFESACPCKPLHTFSCQECEKHAQTSPHLFQKTL